jgi:hypothetical protein
MWAAFMVALPRVKTREPGPGFWGSPRRFGNVHIAVYDDMHAIGEGKVGAV